MLAGVGHNGGPALDDLRAELLFELIGKRKADTALPFKCGAPWTGHASEVELKRLAKLHGRITRRKQSLKELEAERKRIMNRCIKRMRRANGKD
jgi:hypothetical protein